MKLALFAALLAVPAVAFAQPRGAVDTQQIEAVVTVTKVDQKARTVTFKGPQGNLRTLEVPPEAQNLDKVKPGDRFKVVYAEALVLALTPQGGKPSASVDKQVTLAPKGGTPGGQVVRTAQVTGVIDAIDYKNRYVALRGPGQQTYALPVSDEVKELDKVKVGDTVTVAFSQGLALQMIAEPKKPAAKKKSQ